jgi:hypothetical protein
MAMGNCRPASFAASASCTQPRDLGRRPGFVDEDKLLRIKIRLTLEPGLARLCYVVAILLGRRKKRDSVAGLAETPCCATGARRSP